MGGAVDAERHAADHRHARGRQPASERAGDLQPVGRRAPRPDDRHRARPCSRSAPASASSRATPPATKSTAGASSRSRRRAGIAPGRGGRRPRAPTARRPRAARRRPGARARRRSRRPRAPPSPATSSLLGEREDLAQPAPLVAGDLDRAGQPRDEPRPRAGSARAGRGAAPLAAALTPPPPRRAHVVAIAERLEQVLAPRPRSRSARSAIVRATRRTRGRARRGLSVPAPVGGGQQESASAATPTWGRSGARPGGRCRSRRPGEARLLARRAARRARAPGAERTPAARSARRRALDVDVQVDAVQQRPAEAAQVAREVAVGAAAPRRRA